MNFNRRIIYFLFALLILLQNWAFSQEEGEESEQALENIASMEDGQIQLLNEIITIGEKKKFNINLVNESELYSLQLLTPMQITQFINYRKLMGAFISLLEVQAIPYWDAMTAKKTIPFFRIENESNIVPEMKQRIREGEQTILYRTGGYAEQEKGFKQLIKYGFQFKNLIQFGITIEKDAGESNLTDHISGFFSLRKKGIFNNIIIGDYLINMGQGLIHWQGYAFGKSSNIIGGYRQGEFARPHTGSDENRYHRGFAMTVQKKKIFFSLFAGREKIDANIVKDTSSTIDQRGYISSFLTSGLHIKASELEDKNAVTETVLGSRINSSIRTMNLGLNYISTWFDHPIKKRYLPYNYFSMKGDQWQNTSIDFSLNSKLGFAFGEMAIDKNFNKALVSGIIKSLDPRMDITMIYRNISKDFRSIQSNALTQNTEANNEQGLFLCLNLQTNARSKIDGYADHYINKWPGYFTDGIRRGKAYSVQYTWKPNKKTEFYIRWQQDQRNSNQRLDGDKTNRLLLSTNTKWRMHASFMPHESIMIRQRVELSNYGEENTANETGFLTYMEIIYKPMLKPFSISARASVFETEGYNSRIYSYERDLLSYYSIPAFYDKGIRHYLLFNYKFSKKLQFWMKWVFSKTAPGGTVYGGSSFGNSIKKEWRLQVIWNF
jgi:hypothetical protein